MPPDETRTLCYDANLQIEAYRFEGVMQKFPNHFHDYYVIGFIEKGSRYLLCKNQEYRIHAGDLVLFNPGDSHTCQTVNGEALDYRCLNIPAAVMQRSAAEILGENAPPHFAKNVLYHSGLAPLLRELHDMLFRKEMDFEKEELFFFLLEQLFAEYADAGTAAASDFAAAPAPEIEAVCAYLEAHFAQTVTLDSLSRIACISKYHLLHAFTLQKGISPYRCLETIRIGHAKKMLEQGAAPAEAAMAAGFSDQSHFSNFFKKLIGLTPGQYAAIFKDRGGAPKP